MKHKYLRELFSKKEMPFPYGEKGNAAFDERETFSMDATLVAWLYERLRYFQDEASKIVNLSYHKFEIDGRNLSQIECIDRMVEDCKIILLGDKWFSDEDEWNKINAAKDDLFKVLSKVFWVMWW